MSVAVSADGTRIAYESAGAGPALVLVDGAMCDRAGGPMRPLAARLADRFTVLAYDRRGRGESGDTPPWTADREVEDLRAVIGAAGGSAAVCAISSGGALALAAGAAGAGGAGITGLVLYEPPYLAEAEAGAGAADAAKAYSARLEELLAAGARGDAVALFLGVVGVPEGVVAGMRAQPGWASMEALAPTLAYDDRLLNGGRVPREQAGRVRVPVRVLSGGASAAALRGAAVATAEVLAAAGVAADHRELPGQTHDADPAVLGAAVAEFLGA